MTTYDEKLKPYVQFKTAREMDEQVTKYRQNIGYQLNTTDNKLLNYMKAHAVRYTGVFYQLVETISKNIGKSPTTVKRSLKKITDLGIVKRIPTTRKKNGGKGATIFQFQFFKLENGPLDMVHCDSKKEVPNSCGSKLEEKDIESKPFISSKKDLYNKSTYQQVDSMASNTDIDRAKEKITLRKKFEQQLKNRKYSLTTLSEYAKIAYGSINALVKQNAALPKEYLENIVYQKFLSVIDNKNARNPFALFSYAIKKEFNKLIGKSEEKDELDLDFERGIRFERVPQWMIEKEQDPIKKANMIKRNELSKKQREEARKSRAIPEWFVSIENKEDNNKPMVATEKVEQEEKLDYELERRKLMQMLGYN